MLERQSGVFLSQRTGSERGEGQTSGIRETDEKED